MTALVVASNRPESLNNFLREWILPDVWEAVIVVADGARDVWNEVELYGDPFVFTWEDISEEWGPKSWIFSQNDAAIKCFGFLKAVEFDHTDVIVLDDDCLPLLTPASSSGLYFSSFLPAGHSASVVQFINEHSRFMRRPPAWTSSIPGMRLRGMPYQSGLHSTACSTNLLHMGLWEEVPDLDSVSHLHRALRNTSGSRPVSFNLGNFVPPDFVQVMSPKQFWPFSGMNFCFDWRALPALYFPKMGRGTPFARFDDIWCGILMQKVFGATGHTCTVGGSHVRHARQSHVLPNLAREGAGIELNEELWRVVDELDLPAGSSLPETMAEAAAQLKMVDSIPYCRQWGQALCLWLEMCDAVSVRLRERFDELLGDEEAVHPSQGRTPPLMGESLDPGENQATEGGDPLPPSTVVTSLPSTLDGPEAQS